MCDKYLKGKKMSNQNTKFLQLSKWSRSFSNFGYELTYFERPDKIILNFYFVNMGLISLYLYVTLFPFDVTLLPYVSLESRTLLWEEAWTFHFMSLIRLFLQFLRNVVVNALLMKVRNLTNGVLLPTP